MTARVFTSIGNDLDLGIDERDNLILRHGWGNHNENIVQISLGKWTRSKEYQLVQILERLRCHQIKEKN